MTLTIQKFVDEMPCAYHFIPARDNVVPMRTDWPVFIFHRHECVPRSVWCQVYHSLDKVREQVEN